MKGIVCITNNQGARYPGGEPIEFSRDQVVSFGKESRYNDFVVRFHVKLSDGRIVFISATEQSREDEKWLRRLSRKVKFTTYANRENPTIEVWIDIDPEW